MCFEISRYGNYVPIPRPIRSTSYQGLGEPKITRSGWDNANDHVWNQQDEAIPAATLRRFVDRPWGYEQSHDVS